MPDELTLEIVTAIEPDSPDFTDDHKTFLEEHKSELSDDQLTKYGLSKDDDDLGLEDDGKGPPDDEDNGHDRGKGQDDEDIDPDDKANIEKITQAKIDEALTPIKEQQEKSRVSGEWKELINKFPELEKIQPKVLRFASHPSYKGKPVTQTLIEIAGADVFVRIGALREKRAYEKSRNNAPGGGTPAPQAPVKSIGGIPSFVGKTAAQIEQIKRDHRAGKYN